MNPYAGKQVLLTGGLGFIGSNLAIRLVELGAHVTIVDSCLRECGGSFRNVEPVANQVQIVSTDIGHEAAVRPLLKDVDVVFNLAGHDGHTPGMEWPLRDLRINTESQLSFLTMCAEERSCLRIVYASTRNVYGRAQYLPVDERHPVMPMDANGVNKHAAGLFHLMWSYSGSLDAVVLRLTNVYGPRISLNVPNLGILPALFLQVLAGLPVPIYGEGSQLRDPLYVDDAVDAILLCGAAPDLRARIYNVGGPEALSLAEIAATLCRIAHAPLPVAVPFPAGHQIIDTGSFHTDSALIGSHLGWRPKVSWKQGAATTLDFVRSQVFNAANTAMSPRSGESANSQMTF